MDPLLQMATLYNCTTVPVSLGARAGVTVATETGEKWPLATAIVTIVMVTYEEDVFTEVSTNGRRSDNNSVCNLPFTIFWSYSPSY